jgi:hypothetical protein
MITSSKTIPLNTWAFVLVSFEVLLNDLKIVLPVATFTKLFVASSGLVKYLLFNNHEASDNTS